MSEARIDLSHPDAFKNGPPHDCFDRDRRESPVRWIAATPRRGMPIGEGFWSVTRYKTMREVTSDPTSFSSHAGGIRMETYGEEYLKAERVTMLLMDPPDHTVMRRTISKRFIPRIIKQLSKKVETIASEAVRAAVAKRNFDFVNEIAAPVPLIVIAELLGVELEDRNQFRKWSDTIVHASDPGLNVTSDDYKFAYESLREYGRHLYEMKLKKPEDDLISAIAHSDIDGSPMTPDQVVGFWLLLLIAGNETSRNALSGALLAFDKNSNQRERLISNPEFLSTAVEESLRYVSPVLHLRRTATRDTMLDDVQVSSGEKVVFWLPSANRDPEVFENPHSFNITRTPNEHMAFGFGTHFCLGAHLARLEIATVLSEIFKLMPNYEISGPVERVDGNFIQGFRKLPISIGN
jgi:cytochrome P450